MAGPTPRLCAWVTQLRSPCKHPSGGDDVSALIGPGAVSDVVTTELIGRHTTTLAKQKYVYK